MGFKKATQEDSWARVAIVGTSGSGKTYTSLVLGCRIGERIGSRVALIDSERKSANKYAKYFDFDTDALDDQSPQSYIRKIEEAVKLGYRVIIIDSLSHAWMGKGGALEMVDKASAKTSNKFAPWRDVTPLHNRLVDTMLTAEAHIIATLRVKTDWTYEENEKGKKIPVKIGLAPVMRDGIEYEFDITADMDQDHRFIVSKSRCFELADAVILKPGPEVADQLIDWLSSGEPKAKPEPPVNFKKAEPDPEPPATEPEPPAAEQAPAETTAETPPQTDDSTDMLGDMSKCAPSIKALVEKIRPLYQALSPDPLPEDAIVFARIRCCDMFGVGTVAEIPAKDADALKNYLKFGLPDEMRAKGYLPPKRSAS